MTIKTALTATDKIIEYAFYGLALFFPISTAMVEVCSTIILTLFFTKRIVLFFLAWKDRQTAISAPGPRVHQVLARSLKPASTFLSWPVGMFILFNGVSIIFSHDRSLSLNGFFGKIIQSTFLFFIFTEVIRTPRRIQTFIVLTLAAAALTVTNGLIQYRTGWDVSHQKSLVDGRIVSWFNHPNDLGAYLIFLFPLLLGIFLHLWLKRKKPIQAADPLAKGFYTLPGQVGLGLLFLAALICLGLTFSRGAWLGFFAALLFMGLIRKRVLYINIGIAIIFIVIFSHPLAQVRNVSLISDDLTYRRNITVPQEQQSWEEDLSSTLYFSRLKENLGEKVRISYEGFIDRFSGMGRNYFWKEAQNIIRDFPVFGIGLNTYSKVAPNYKLNWGGYPHNCYLQMASEIGLPGLFCFLWILWRIFIRGIRRLIGKDSSYWPLVYCGVLAGLFGFLAHSFIDTNLYSVQLGNMMWVQFGLLVAIDMYGLKDPPGAQAVVPGPAGSSTQA